MLNSLKNIIFSIILTITFILGHSVSDAFINVSKEANPSVVSIVGTQESQNNLKNDPFYAVIGSNQ